jgi:hypothetical protein
VTIKELAGLHAKFQVEIERAKRALEGLVTEAVLAQALIHKALRSAAFTRSRDLHDRESVPFKDVPPDVLKQVREAVLDGLLHEDESGVYIFIAPPGPDTWTATWTGGSLKDLLPEMPE